jgi:predicted ThiF/HesA family dinucleotide-utilizing enzyme
MIAGGDGVHAGTEQLARGRWSDAGAACGVFSIGDDEVKAVLRTKRWKQLSDCHAARRTNDIPDEENSHRVS